MITPDKARQTRLYDRLNVCNANLTIEWDALEGKQEVFDGLNILNLSHNRIKSIPLNLPYPCPKLTRLDLSHNEISDLSLPRAVPAGLKQLNVSHNEILRLDSYKSKVDPLPCTNPKVCWRGGREGREGREGGRGGREGGEGGRGGGRERGREGRRERGKEGGRSTVLYVCVCYCVVFFQLQGIILF